MTGAVLFDLMGTLLIESARSPGDSFGNLHRVLQEGGLLISREELAGTFQQIPARAAPAHLTSFEDQLVRICARHGLQASDAQAREMASAICSYANEVVAADPDAHRVIDELRQRGPVGLVTNYDHPPNVHYLLDRDRLRACFEVVVVSAEINLWKPDPRILLAAVEQLRMPVDDVVYVGDSDVDIQAAAGAGMRSILIRRRGGPSDPLRGSPDPAHGHLRPDLVVSRLSEIPEVLSHL